MGLARMGCVRSVGRVARGGGSAMEEVEFSSLLTVKTHRHDNGCLPPGELQAPATVLIVWITNTKNGCAREGHEVAMGRGTVAMIDLRLPTGSPTTSTTRLPPSPPPERGVVGGCIV